MNIKVIILVLSAEFEPYISLESVIRETWGKEKLPEIEIFYYYGQSSNKKIFGDKIYSTYHEGLYNIGYKTLDAFKLIKNFNFDYIFRTNSSSYVYQKNLLNFLEDKPKENFYCGIIGNHDSIPFCSGSGYFLSKDLLIKVLNSAENWNHDLIDDVAMGDLIINKLKVSPNSDAKRLDLDKLNYNLNLIKQHYHFRCKVESDRKIDERHMYNLHSLFAKNLV